ncbi:MAG: hypothetical protein E6J41_33425 [Chloroflexi bacterium]|nr:MAG: hypothetical protein E6J41_33425 [Chloroflexota bacterium]
MSYWTKLALAISSALTLLVVALTTGGAGTALRAVGANAAVAAAAAPIDAQAGGDHTTAPGKGAIQITIGPTWTIQPWWKLTGEITATCGPFLHVPSGSDLATVTIKQHPDMASGATGGHATGSVFLRCDGAAHTYTVTAWAGGTFVPGTATAAAFAFAAGIDPVTFRFEFQTGQAGPQQVNIA